MTDLVYCRACRKRVSEDAIKEIRGEFFCPKCYPAVAAKLKADKEEKQQAEAEKKKSISSRRQAPAFSTKPKQSNPEPINISAPDVSIEPGIQVSSPSEKLAGRAGGVVGPRQAAGVRGVQSAAAQPAPAAPRAPSLPDLPPEMLMAAGKASEDRSVSNSFGPAVFGWAIYLGVPALGFFVAHYFVKQSGGISMASLALQITGVLLAVGAGIAALFNLLSGNELRKKICGAIGGAIGVTIACIGIPGFAKDGRKWNEEKGLSAIVDQANGAPAKKPEATPEAKPEPKPVPKPETKPETKPEVKPVPKPELSAAEKLQAELRAALPGAAMVEASALAAGSRKLEELDNQPLTAVLLLTKPVPGLRGDLETQGQPKTFAELTEAMRIGEHLSVMRDSAITKLDCMLRDANSAVGEVQVRLAGYAGQFPFEARRKDNAWQIVSFSLTASGRKVTLENGKWKVSEAATTDAAVRFARATAGFDASALPTATQGVKPDGKALAAFGELRLSGKPPAPLTEGAKGVLLALPAKATVSEMLSAAKDGDAWRPSALVLAGGTTILRVPEITAEPGQTRLTPLVISIAKKDGGKEGEFEVVVQPDIRFGTDAASINTLTMKLSQVAAVRDTPVRFAPQGDVPLSLFVQMLDICLQARLKPELMTVNPAGAATAPAPTPAPAAQ